MRNQRCWSGFPRRESNSVGRIVGFLLVPLFSFVVALAWFDIATRNWRPVSTPFGVFARSWTESVFLLPIVGLLQPLAGVPLFFLIRHRNEELARGLLYGTLTTFVICIPLTWLSTTIISGLAGLR